MTRDREHAIGDEPILAVASARDRSLRGVVRLSGAGTLELLFQRLSECRAIGDTDRIWPARGLYIARLRLRDHDLPLLALSFPGPRSYTGEDCAELHTVGNPFVLDCVIDELLSDPHARELGARRAGPGEFTARAYLNQRLSLTEAEGVERSISARSDAELRAAHQLTAGRLGDLAHALADELAGALALVEAGIDFTDQEDVIAIGPRDLLHCVQSITSRINGHLEHAIGAESMSAIPTVVLVGPPNAGKSTLFNALLGRERAIVSAIAGTTRDVLSEPLTLQTPRGPAEIMLADLAGLDVTDDAWLNLRLLRHAREAMNRADLLIVCVPPESRDWRDGSLPARIARINIRTKADLTSEPGSSLPVSSKTGAGVGDLRKRIATTLAEDLVPLGAEVLALKPRHESALRAALVALCEAIEMIEPQVDSRHLHHPELIASSLRGALNRIGELAGDVTPDDVLGRIFATFCVGK